MKLKKIVKDKDRTIEILNAQNKALKEKLEESERVVKKYKSKSKKNKKTQKAKN